MTTVTEAAKRLGIDLHPLEQADLRALKADPVLAQQFARRLQAAAQTIVPATDWSVEDLRDVLEIAIQGAPPEAVRVVEGRYLRKRVREQCAYAERYGEPFALVVLKLAPEPSEGAYQVCLDALVARLRRSDMMAIYKRRLALLLPRVHPTGVGGLLARVRDAVDGSIGRPVIEAAPVALFPDASYPDTQSMLDWLEDRLRPDDPS